MTKKMTMTQGEIARLLRCRSGLTIPEWAKLKGVTPCVVRELERGELSPVVLDPDTRAKLGVQENKTGTLLMADAGEEAMLYRLRAGMTLHEAATKIGVTAPTILTYEGAGDSAPALAHRNRMKSASRRKQKRRNPRKQRTVA